MYAYVKLTPSVFTLNMMLTLFFEEKREDLLAQYIENGIS